MAVRDKQIPLELQDLFVKREFAEAYGFTPEMVDKMPMRYINGFRAISLAQQQATPPEPQNNVKEQMLKEINGRTNN